MEFTAFQGELMPEEALALLYWCISQIRVLGIVIEVRK